MDTYGYARKLAKSDEYQALFSLGKEMPHVKIFSNEENFTDIQIIFLKFLSMYSTILLDIALNEIDNRVLENEIYEDSYLMYKNTKDKIKKFPKEPEKTVPTSRWLFKSPQKRK
jgi:hypothetical protein